eukprot:gnl/MRDRNA2_/MRDRNA2_83349_c0_seq3.p2 gnl/MRDRNA2_/MRDRNA2_83349_c0~~gnl/MRDRNA2_/MRDRNA2_83349_c0_seq3.p2  ORF type:complete len:130 (+),score=36.32 gnl/MRDRNA2_/MRDRNA2_83349_c0_seq3:93-482(+)
MTSRAHRVTQGEYEGRGKSTKCNKFNVSHVTRASYNAIFCMLMISCLFTLALAKKAAISVDGTGETHAFHENDGETHVFHENEESMGKKAAISVDDTGETHVFQEKEKDTNEDVYKEEKPVEVEFKHSG